MDDVKDIYTDRGLSAGLQKVLADSHARWTEYMRTCPTEYKALFPRTYEDLKAAVEKPHFPFPIFGRHGLNRRQKFAQRQRSIHARRHHG